MRRCASPGPRTASNGWRKWYESSGSERKSQGGQKQYIPAHKRISGRPAADAAGGGRDHRGRKAASAAVPRLLRLLEQNAGQVRIAGRYGRCDRENSCRRRADLELSALLFQHSRPAQAAHRPAAADVAAVYDRHGLRRPPEPVRPLRPAAGRDLDLRLLYRRGQL